MSYAQLHTNSEKIKQMYESVIIERNELDVQKAELDDQAQIIEENKSKIILLEKIARNTFAKANQWICIQQSSNISSYFKKSAIMTQSIVSNGEIQEESKVNIPMGKKLEARPDLLSPIVQDAKETENSPSVVEFPLQEDHINTNKSIAIEPNNNHMQAQQEDMPTDTNEDNVKQPSIPEKYQNDNECIPEEESKEPSENYDSLSFVPNPDFLKNINKNIQQNDNKINGDSPDNRGDSQLMQIDGIMPNDSTIKSNLESNMSSFVDQSNSNINGGLVFPSFPEKDANDSDEEKDQVVNGKLYDQKNKAKYGIKPYIKKG